MEPVIDWADRGDTSSLQSLTRASKAIVTGQVIDTDVGFFKETLNNLRISEFLG